VYTSSDLGSKMEILVKVAYCVHLFQRRKVSALILYVLCSSECLLRENTHGISSSFFSGFVLR
jgi:hypothetical protein